MNKRQVKKVIIDKFPSIPITQSFIEPTRIPVDEIASFLV